MKYPSRFAPFLIFSLLFVSTANSFAGGFHIINRGVPSPICSLNDSPVVRTAVSVLCQDLEVVSGNAVELIKEQQAGCIMTGTVKDFGDKFSESVSIEPENYLIRVSDSCLYVVGSDDMGIAYGLMEISRMLGVSPWEWWADVKPQKKLDVSVPAGFRLADGPKVRYRGIFINDEDFAFVPWSKKYEGSEISGMVGPKTYSKLFELLLRLKANAIWPAMHPSTIPFYMVPGNKEAAARYGIYVGTSHCEPMMRNNVGEWNHSVHGEYNFKDNSSEVLTYWKERLSQINEGEDILCTIGMRGIHDGKIEGAETLDEQTVLTSKAIAAQRELIRESGRAIPQFFMPYKEVLDIYNNGLEVPQDVTLVWCDDNYGYLTRLPDSAERRRSGGNGIYYHISYWGSPMDYLWLCSNQPALMVEQMKTAYAKGADRLWILNVGDLKPAEYQTQLFLDMAWNPACAKEEDSNEHLKLWTRNVFGKEFGEKAFDILNLYYSLTSIRRPEHMAVDDQGRSLIRKGMFPGEDLPFSNDDVREIESRCDELLAMLDAAGSPNGLEDAWFQLVEYPVRGASLFCKKLAFLQKAVQNGNSADYNLARKCHKEINDLTARYNSGKWDGMMSCSPRGHQFFIMPGLNPSRVKLPLDKGPIVQKIQGAKIKGSIEIRNLGQSRECGKLPVGIGCSNSFRIKEEGEYLLELCFIPRHPSNGSALRCEIIVDQSVREIIDIAQAVKSPEWKTSVIRGRTIRNIGVHLTKGHHTVTFKALDEDVVVDEIVVRSRPAV